MIILFYTNEKLTYFNCFIHSLFIHCTRSTLFKIYWINRNVAGTAMLDLTQAIIYQCIYNSRLSYNIIYC